MIKFIISLFIFLTFILNLSNGQNKSPSKKFVFFIDQNNLAKISVNQLDCSFMVNLCKWNVSNQFPDSKWKLVYKPYNQKFLWNISYNGISRSTNVDCKFQGWEMKIFPGGDRM